MADKTGACLCGLSHSRLRNHTPVRALPDCVGGGQEAPVARRRGRTIGTFIVGACVFLLFAHALFGKRLHWSADSLPFMKAESASEERLLSLGTAVLAADGIVVGKVSGLSRDSRGHVERIRVVGPMPMGFGQRTLIIRDTYFKVEGHAVQLKLSVAELNVMPRAMTEDNAAGFPRLF